MSNIEFRKRMKAGDVLLGLITNFNSADAIEFLGDKGIDYVIIDGEHGSFGIDSIQQMVRAARSVGLAAVVRVPDSNPKAIMQVCDAGADGVMLPQVETASSAGLLCQSLRYPPLGIRGMHGGTPAANWGRRAVLEHIDAENTGVCSIVQIETVAGVEDAKGILSAEGVDAVLVGPNDLALSMGIPGEIGQSKVWEATAQVFSVAKDLGVTCGGLGQTAEQVKLLTAAGASMILGDLPTCLGDGVSDFVSRAAG